MRSGGFVLDDPDHPALRGEYTAGAVSTIDYYRERRQLWEAVEIYLTMACPLSCAHCVSNSHPGRKERMDEGLLLRLIESLASLGATRYVCLFGGEPSAEPALLRAAIVATRDAGMLPSSVTAGTWATSDAVAAERASLFDGLNALLISTDRSHARFIGVDTVIRAAAATLRRGINASVCYAAEPDEFTGATPLPVELTLAAERLGFGIVVTPISAAGRAWKRPAMVSSLPTDRGCGKIDVPLVGCHGDVYACGPGWTIPSERESKWKLGRFPDDSLAEMMRRAETSPMIRTIRERGPLALLQDLAEGSPPRQRELAEARPQSPCAACQLLATWVGAPTLAHASGGSA
jgi:hypothetical protein